MPPESWDMRVERHRVGVEGEFEGHFFGGGRGLGGRLSRPVPWALRRTRPGAGRIGRWARMNREKVPAAFIDDSFHRGSSISEIIRQTGGRTPNLSMPRTQRAVHLRTRPGGLPWPDNAV